GKDASAQGRSPGCGATEIHLRNQILARPFAQAGKFAGSAAVDRADPVNIAAGAGRIFGKFVEGPQPEQRRAVIIRQVEGFETSAPRRHVPTGVNDRLGGEKRGWKQVEIV